MSEFTMIKCDNPTCKSTANENNKDGWIQLEKKTYGRIYDGDCEVTYEVTSYGESSSVKDQIELPESADYCCIDCMLIALRLK